jgi:hypothetical protein
MVPGMLDVKGTKILAKSLFKELRGNGYSTNQILSLSTELIDLVTQDLKGEHDAPAADAPVPMVLDDKAKEGWRAAL